MHFRNQGYTLIELMLVVTIISILVVIALPAYFSYATRSRISEALVAAAAVKQSVTEAYLTRGDWPTSNTIAGFNAIGIKTKYIQRIEIGKIDANHGRFSIVLDVPGHEGETLVYVGQPVQGGVDWSCDGSGGQDGTLDHSYRPQVCR